MSTCLDDIPDDRRDQLLSRTTATIERLLRHHHNDYDLCIGCSLRLVQLTIFTTLAEHMHEDDHPGHLAQVTLKALQEVFSDQISVIDEDNDDRTIN